MNSYKLKYLSHQYLKSFMLSAKSIDKEAEIREDLLNLQKFITVLYSEKSDYKSIEEEFIFANESRLDFLLSQLKRIVKLQCLTINFIKLFVINKDYKVLKYFLLNLRELLLEYDLVVQVKVFSVLKLNIQQKSKIDSFFKNYLKNNYVIDYIVDESLLSGMIIKINDKIYDDTLLSKLNKVKLLLQE